MRTYKSRNGVTPYVPPAPRTPSSRIDEHTKTISIQDASELLEAERGLKLSPKTIRAYCSTGKWERGIHWVKPGRDYLINMAAVYEWIVR